MTHTRPLFLIACHAWYDDTLGGAFRVATEFAEGLAELGHRVAYVCGARQPPAHQPVLERGVAVWRYAYPQAPSPSPANLWGHVMRSRRLVRQIVRDEPVVTLNGHSPLQALGAALAVGRRARLTYTVHSPIVDELLANWAGHKLRAGKRIALAIANQVERANLRRASTVHCLSRYIQSLLAARYGANIAAKTVVSPGWVKTGLFRPAAERPSLRASLGAPWRPDVTTFLTLRRLERRMGIEQLIEASRLLADAGHSFQVLIGGAGSLREELGALADQLNLADYVKFLGRLPEESVASAFAAADCFVLPTQELEGFGLIILESYASGTPVIGTPVGAIPEVIGAGRQHWLAADKSARALADKMAEFLGGGLSADAVELVDRAGEAEWLRGTGNLAEICFPTAALQPAP